MYHPPCLDLTVFVLHLVNVSHGAKVAIAALKTYISTAAIMPLMQFSYGATFAGMHSLP